MCLTRYEQDIADRNYAMLHWLNRIEAGLWRMHKFAEFDSWEERHYYDGLRLLINHRDRVEGVPFEPVASEQVK